jgi:hypothetical protein
VHDLVRFVFVGSIYLSAAIGILWIVIKIQSMGEPRRGNSAPSFVSLILGRLFPRRFPLNAPARSDGQGRKRRRSNPFRTARAAKEYLAGRITEEARREGTPLTEVERKMLYFTESGWTLPDMIAVNEEFERDYDDDEYEQKIGGLVAKIQASDAKQSEQDQAAWDDAVMKLVEGDHYILVLIDAAPSPLGIRSSQRTPLRRFLPAESRPGRREPGDIVRLIVAAIAISFVLLMLPFLLGRIFGPDWSYNLHHFLR